jgi:tRNA (guanine37-N1)-methyltransferase
LSVVVSYTVILHIGDVACQEEDANQTKKRNNKKVKSARPLPVKPWVHMDHVVMNLPASALQFLGNVISSPNFLSHASYHILSIFWGGVLFSFSMLCAMPCHSS